MCLRVSRGNNHASDVCARTGVFDDVGTGHYSDFDQRKKRVSRGRARVVGSPRARVPVPCEQIQSRLPLLY